MESTTELVSASWKTYEVPLTIPQADCLYMVQLIGYQMSVVPMSHKGHCQSVNCCFPLASLHLPPSHDYMYQIQDITYRSSQQKPNHMHACQRVHTCVCALTQAQIVRIEVWQERGDLFQADMRSRAGSCCHAPGANRNIAQHLLCARPSWSMHSCSHAHLAVRHGGERLCPAPARLTDSSQVKIVHFQVLLLAQYEAMSVKATCHHTKIERALTSVSCRCKVIVLPRHGRWKVHRCELVRVSKHRCSLGLRSCSSAIRI